MNNIVSFPLSGRILDNKGLRVYTKSHYQIIYRIDAKNIVILHIWDSSGNPEDLKL